MGKKYLSNIFGNVDKKKQQTVDRQSVAYCVWSEPKFLGKRVGKIIGGGEPDLVGDLGDGFFGGFQQLPAFLQADAPDEGGDGQVRQGLYLAVQLRLAQPHFAA